ncbi:MAG: hypothetical protein RLZZ232_3787 [Planctomycetota bacterium]|jgi:hypothetical protein
MNKTKVGLSERALLARINRKLVAECRQVRKCRVGTSGHAELGDYYCVDLQSNFVDSKHIDLQIWGRKMKVLAPYEELIE